MSFYPLTQDDFTNRAREWTSQPANAFNPIQNTSYTTWVQGVSAPSRWVVVSVSGSYTFTMLGSQSVAITLTAGVQYAMQATAWTAGPGGGVVTFFW